MYILFVFQLFRPLTSRKFKLDGELSSARVDNNYYEDMSQLDYDIGTWPNWT